MRSTLPEPTHPGKILEEEILWPLDLSANTLAKRLDVPVTRISEIIRGRRGITADTALRLARLFGTSADLWLGMQMEFDLSSARQDLGDELEKNIAPWKRDSAANIEGSLSGSRVRKPAGGGRHGDRRRIRRKIRPSRGPMAPSEPKGPDRG